MADTLEETQFAERRAKVADLYLRGRPQTVIAAELKISQPTVSRDLAMCREEWKSRMAEDFAAKCDQELARIDRLELEYWTGWERSVGRHVVVRETVSGGDKPAEITETAEELAGDHRFLNGVGWCIERRCRLMGLDAPKRIDAAGMREVMKVLAGVDMERL